MTSRVVAASLPAIHDADPDASRADPRTSVVTMPADRVARDHATMRANGPAGRWASGLWAALVAPATDDEPDGRDGD